VSGFTNKDALTLKNVLIEAKESSIMTTVNILLVDDNLENLLALEALLETPEYNLVKARSGEGALRCLLDQDFAVILLDVRMPSMDGFDTATLIRGRERSRHTPIIFLTGYENNTVNLFKGYSLGAVDYLVKPIVPEILKAKVAVFVDLFRKNLDLQYQLQEIRELKHDVKEHMRINEERRQLLARERTARADAEQAVRERDEFLSVAAHELKTPVTSLRGFAQTILRQMKRNEPLDPERIRHALETIDQQSTKLSQLVSQLLDISRIEAGQLQLDKQATNITDLVNDIINMLQPNLIKHTIAFSAPDAIWVSVDSLRLEQVITNLIDNAIKYSPDGGPVNVDIWTANENFASIAVTDCGIGIPVEHREHIFDRFYRAHANSHYGGIGLGLYISHQIMQLHSGKLEVEFPDQGGTRFIAHLPLDSDPQ
jgi:signal transduction histidine kinase